MTNITNTFNTLDSALEGAKAAGNDIFSGYENEIRYLKGSVKTLGINKFLLTDTGLLLMIVEFQGERLLNEVTLSTCVSAHDLTLAIIDDNQITPCPALISKSDTKSRKEASRWYYLIDQGLASKLAA